MSAPDGPAAVEESDEAQIAEIETEGAPVPSPAIIQATLERIPDSEVREALEMIHIEARTTRGPLPPASALVEYEAALPGLAREIVDNSKVEQNHRHRMDERTGTQEFVLNIAGLVAILLALFMMLAIVAYMVFKGAPIAGATLGTGIIVSVVVALTNYRKSEPTPMPSPPAKIEAKEAKPAE